MGVRGGSRLKHRIMETLGAVRKTDGKREGVQSDAWDHRWVSGVVLQTTHEYPSSFWDHRWVRRMVCGIRPWMGVHGGVLGSRGGVWNHTWVSWAVLGTIDGSPGQCF